jgi:pimeloyl-ACP methyl ester carboxylesterase
MTVVLVNGNPETQAVWEPLVAALGRDDTRALSPPGFGGPVPDGFDATYDEYVDWLGAELEAIGHPVDLVGHDWGANFTVRLACERPELLRSWCVDTGGSFAPGYAFPDVCHVWQTPGAGEAAIAAWLDLGVPGRTTVNVSLGMTAAVAGELAAAFDESMGRCILALYRSVPEEVLAQWGRRSSAASARPGLVVIPTEDSHTGGEARHRWFAAQASAKVTVLQGLGHWWMLQDPASAADELRRFWSEL